jgi:hypothetical protein
MQAINQREDSSCHDCFRQLYTVQGFSPPGPTPNYSFVMGTCGRYLGLHRSPSSSRTHVPDFIASHVSVERTRRNERPTRRNKSSKTSGCDNQLHELFTYYIEFSTPFLNYCSTSSLSHRTSSLHRYPALYGYLIPLVHNLSTQCNVTK